MTETVPEAGFGYHFTIKTSEFRRFLTEIHDSRYWDSRHDLDASKGAKKLMGEISLNDQLLLDYAENQGDLRAISLQTPRVIFSVYTVSSSANNLKKSQNWRKLTA